MLNEVEVRLPPGLAVRHLQAKRAVLEHFRSLLAQGMAAGEFRKTDHSITAFAIIGMMNWSTWWFNSKGRFEIATVAQTLADFALRLVAVSDAQDQQLQSPGELIERMENDLALLKTQLTQYGRPSVSKL